MLFPPGSTSKVDLTFGSRGVVLEYVSWYLKTNEMKHVFTLFALVLMSSVLSTSYGQESCPNVYDYNDNNTIDIEDFLGILGLFADDDTDDDGI